MRAILIVNPNATTTTPRTRDIIIRALSSAIDLEVFDTTHRLHATDLARQARRDGLDAVITLGGDGTVNEAVNGLLSDGVAAGVPMLGTIPGGSANVFARSLGLSEDPVDATAEIIEALAEGRRRTIGLGLAQYNGRKRYFMCNAGLGIDAEIIEEMDRQRASGASATPARYVGTALTQFFTKTERREPAFTIERPEQLTVDLSWTDRRRPLPTGIVRRRIRPLRSAQPWRTSDRQLRAAHAAAPAF